MTENSNDMTTPQEPIPAQMGEPIAPATPLPTTAVEKGKGVRTYVLVGASALVGAVLVLVGGAVGYSIGQHDGDNHRGAELTVSADRNGQQGGEYGNQNGNPNSDGGMMGGHRDEMMPGQREMDMRGQQGGAGNGPMMQGNGIQDFLDQLQGGQGLSPDQQQFLDQLKGFVGGMRNQMG